MHHRHAALPVGIIPRERLPATAGKNAHTGIQQRFCCGLGVICSAATRGHALSLRAVYERDFKKEGKRKEKGESLNAKRVPGALKLASTQREALRFISAT